MAEQRLRIDDQDRYARLRLISWWDQSRLAGARVMVVGAGALGNEVLKNLALVGIGRVDIVDLDRVETANLSRSVLFRAGDRGRPKAEVAAAAVRALNPDVRVQAVCGNVQTAVGLGWFRRADVVIGCLDNREARWWVNRCCWKMARPWIDGGIQELNGVVKVFTPPRGACYECAMTENDYRLMNLRYRCPPGRVDEVAEGNVPTTPTIAAMIGGWQTQEALKLLHGMPVGEGEALVYNGQTNRFYRTQFQRREDCGSHERYQPVLELATASAGGTAHQLFAALRGRLELPAVTDAPLCLVLDRDLLVSVRCPACVWEQAVMQPMPLAAGRDGMCPGCGEPVRPQLQHRIEEGSDLAGHALVDLGVPAYDVVRVASGSHEWFVLLDADRDMVEGGDGG